MFENNSVMLEPFPHFVVKDFFDQKNLEDLNLNFPKIPDKFSEMYGRKRMENKGLNNLDFLECKDFKVSLFKKFKPFLLKETSIDFKSPIRFTTENITTYKGSNLFKIYYDVSEAHNGYFREVHTDYYDRVINFLIYLNDPVCEGGELIFYESNEKTIHRRQFPSNVKVHTKFKIERNKALFFLSNKKSYHSVNVITDTKIPRRFVYGSITSCNRKGVWK